MTTGRADTTGPSTTTAAPAAPARFAPRPKVDPRWTKLLWPLVALLLLLAIDVALVGVRSGNLSGNLVNTLERATFVLLAATGMTLVIATGGVDLSVGSVMAISGAVAARLVVAGTPTPVAVAAALGVALLAGLWNGSLVALLGIQPIVATLILLVAGRGVAQLVTQGQKVPFTDPALTFLGEGHLLGLPFAVTVGAVVMLATALLTRKTAAGLFVEAVGGNATASRYAGVNAAGVKLAVYVFSAVCAGVAGLIAAADIREADPFNAGQNMELDAILAVVIGGTALTGGRFSLPGTVLGALVIQMLTTTILHMGVNAQWTLVVKALVVVVVCLLQSEGLREVIRSRLQRSRPRPRGFEPVLNAAAAPVPSDAARPQ
jgi:ribose/xylose/arabinose/galactoside ABC-type transport system permease subunit